MKRSHELWVLTDEARDLAAIERCVLAAGHRIAGMAHSVAELRVRLAEQRARLVQPERVPERMIVLLYDAAMVHDPDSADAVTELVRATGLPAVQLAASLVASPAASPAAPIDAASDPAYPDAGHVTCALAPRELSLAVELAATRRALVQADAERARQQHELHQLQRLLARRATDLQATSDELEAFAFSVSHDLRAPMRAIEGLSQIILDKLDDGVDPRLHTYLHHIREASLRMSRLLDDLLGLSRLMRAEMHIQPCDLSAMARDILHALRQTSPARPSGYTVDIEVAPGVEVLGDRKLLRVALENLLGNAWKFTSTRPAARIELGVTARDGQPAYYVRDNGAGFDMANAGKLFGAFQRMHGAHEFDGTGIGLAQVQRIVRRHGGDIWAEAAVGRGATFTFTLSASPPTTT
jgi:signal transduction histidine kinase